MFKGSTTLFVCTAFVRLLLILMMMMMTLTMMMIVLDDDLCDSTYLTYYDIFLRRGRTRSSPNSECFSAVLAWYSKIIAASILGMQLAAQADVSINSVCNFSIVLLQIFSIKRIRNRYDCHLIVSHKMPTITLSKAVPLFIQGVLLLFRI